MTVEQIETIVLTTTLSLLASILTAFLTSRVACENEIRKTIHEKRLELYMSFYEQVELVLKDREIVFDEGYFLKVGEFKAKMTLLASDKTRSAFEDFFWFVRQKWVDYKKYNLSHDPQLDESRYHTEYDENGCEVEWTDISQSEIQAFDDEVRKYKKDNKPSKTAIEEYTERIYQAMRNDLGSNLDEEGTINGFLQRHCKHK